MPHVTAYLCVSTVDRDLEMNKADMLRLANTLELGHVHFVKETVSGKVVWRNRENAEILAPFLAGES